MFQNCQCNTSFAVLADDSSRKGVHAGRPQGEAHNEIHSRGADDTLIDERILGYERDPGEPRSGEPNVWEMTLL